jgi:excisionase family DNA binding protein
MTTSGNKGSRPLSPEESMTIRVSITIERDQLAALSDVLRRIIREQLSEQQSRLKDVLTQAATVVTPEEEKPASSQSGIVLTKADRVSAGDLRTALLLGKVPEEADLLLDTKTMAGLLGVSDRTLYRLLAEKALPEPLRLGARAVRWRLAEILEWVDAGCPAQKHWTYPRTTARKRS